MVSGGVDSPPRVRGGLPVLLVAECRDVAIPPPRVATFEPSPEDRLAALEGAFVPAFGGHEDPSAWLLVGALLLVLAGTALLVV